MSESFNKFNAMAGDGLPTLAQLNALTEGVWPGAVGVEFTTLSPGRLGGRLVIRADHHAPNGFLHAGVVVSFADTLCGFGCRVFSPPNASGFTTIELKTNFLGTALAGVLVAEAVLIHGGRSTQVWDATVRLEETEKVIALFRCTQMILYPKPS